MMRIIKMFRKAPWWAKYILIFCIGMLITSVVYPYIQAYAMAHRASTAPGGEMLLWLLPFILLLVIDTAKEHRKVNVKK